MGHAGRKGMPSSAPGGDEKMRTKKVCIIGAGAAGLVAAKVFRDNPRFSVVVYEREASIGGLWRYDGTTPIYKSLRTNLPKEIMGYLDWPMPDSYPTFMAHSGVLEYLQCYAALHNLESIIRFGTPVTSLKRGEGLTKAEEEREEVAKVGEAARANEATAGVVSRQEIRCAPIQSSSTSALSPENGKWIVNGEEEFDVVAVANGHHEEPYRISLHDPNFQGLVMHSRDYDEPSLFAGKRVLVVGAGSSGVDIARDLSDAAKIVFWSHRTFMDSARVQQVSKDYPSSVAFIGPVSFVDQNGAFTADIAARGSWKRPVVTDPKSLGDDARLVVDAIVYATGFVPSFPFFPKELTDSWSAAECEKPLQNGKEQFATLDAEGANVCTSSPSRKRSPGQGRHPIFDDLHVTLAHKAHPSSLFLIGLPHQTLTLPLFQIQAEAAVALALHGEASVEAKLGTGQETLEDVLVAEATGLPKSSTIPSFDPTLLNQLTTFPDPLLDERWGYYQLIQMIAKGDPKEALRVSCGIVDARGRNQKYVGTPETMEPWLKRHQEIFDVAAEVRNLYPASFREVYTRTEP